MKSTPLSAAGKAVSHAVERADDGSITITRVTYVLPPDELIPFPFGVEAAAARALIRAGRLRAVKVGRRVYARRSDVLGLVDAAPRASNAAPADTSYNARELRKQKCL